MNVFHQSTWLLSSRENLFSCLPKLTEFTVAKCRVCFACNTTFLIVYLCLFFLLFLLLLACSLVSLLLSSATSSTTLMTSLPTSSMCCRVEEGRGEERDFTACFVISALASPVLFFPFYFVVLFSSHFNRVIICLVN